MADDQSRKRRDDEQPKGNARAFDGDTADHADQMKLQSALKPAPAPGKDANGSPAKDLPEGKKPITLDQHLDGKSESYSNILRGAVDTALAKSSIVLPRKPKGIKRSDVRGIGADGKREGGLSGIDAPPIGLKPGSLKTPIVLGVGPKTMDGKPVSGLVPLAEKRAAERKAGKSLDPTKPGDVKNGLVPNVPGRTGPDGKPLATPATLNQGQRSPESRGMDPSREIKDLSKSKAANAAAEKAMKAAWPAIKARLIMLSAGLGPGAAAITAAALNILPGAIKAANAVLPKTEDGNDAVSLDSANQAALAARRKAADKILLGEGISAQTNRNVINLATMGMAKQAQEQARRKHQAETRAAAGGKGSPEEDQETEGEVKTKLSGIQKTGIAAGVSVAVVATLLSGGITGVGSGAGGFAGGGMVQSDGDTCTTTANYPTGGGSGYKPIGSPVAVDESDPQVGAANNLNAEQKSNVLEIIRAAESRDLSDELKTQAAITAIATAMQESTLKNVMHGDSWGPDSIGLFQQRDPWGTREERTTPFISANLFLDRLLKIPGWESMEMYQAIQKVQISRYPMHYAKWGQFARKAYNNAIGGGSQVQALAGGIESVKGAGFMPLTQTGSGTMYQPGANDAVWNSGITDDIRAAYIASRTQFPEIKSYIGRVPRSTGGDHPHGKALDIMVPDYKSPSGIALGDRIAAHFVANQAKFGIEYVIWRNKIWHVKTNEWRPYNGGGMYNPATLDDNTLHNNHVHISAQGNGGDYDLADIEGGGGDATTTGGDAAGCSASGEAAGNYEAGNTNWDGSTTPSGNIWNGIKYAENDPSGYPYANVLAGYGKSARFQSGNADPFSFVYRECTSFVAWKMNLQMGWKPGEPPKFSKATMGMTDGNARAWAGALKRKGYTVDNIPKKGAIAWWDSGHNLFGSYGHVAVVAEVFDNGNVLVEQYNMNRWMYSTWVIPADFTSGYIHVADIEE